MKKIFLSVIVPSYNESQNIKRNALDNLIIYLANQNYSYEIILADDGSNDETLNYLDQFAKVHKNVVVLKNQHQGKGPTVAKAMLQATGEWRLFTDFDQSTPISEIEKLLRYIKDYDCIIGSREGIGAKREKEPLHRHLMGRIFNLLVQILAVKNVKDSQCGFKLFSAKLAEDIFPRLKIYRPDHNIQQAFTGAFDVEVLFLARKLGYKIKEVGITWKHFETSRVNPIKDSIKMLQDILKIRLTHLQGKYHLS